MSEEDCLTLFPTLKSSPVALEAFEPAQGQYIDPFNGLLRPSDLVLFHSTWADLSLRDIFGGDSDLSEEEEKSRFSQGLAEAELAPKRRRLNAALFPAPHSLPGLPPSSAPDSPNLPLNAASPPPPPASSLPIGQSRSQQKKERNKQKRQQYQKTSTFRDKKNKKRREKRRPAEVRQRQEDSVSYQTAAPMNAESVSIHGFTGHWGKRDRDMVDRLQSKAQLKEALSNLTLIPYELSNFFLCGCMCSGSPFADLLQSVAKRSHLPAGC